MLHFIGNTGFQFAAPEATIINLGPVSENYSYIERGFRNCRLLCYQRLVQTRHLTRDCVFRIQPLVQRLSTIRARFRLQSQPRPRLFFLLLAYFFLVHFLLLRCWLL
ncbi:unnamed protein product [Echinostoma caproni]|uniref:DDE Tnp4 domain-containing protein n=1 Tax=Echinostoma caproni TaxID=27848 RepID=A0A183BCD2_9TREM|nr:unnamed protein product [Echinostoma caproni]